MTDVHEARVEAAARATFESFVSVGRSWEQFKLDDPRRADVFLADARVFLNAADKLVTVEMIAEVIDDLIDVPPRTTRLLADEIHSLLTGEGA